MIALFQTKNSLSLSIGLGLAVFVVATATAREGHSGSVKFDDCIQKLKSSFGEAAGSNEAAIQFCKEVGGSNPQRPGGHSFVEKSNSDLEKDQKQIPAPKITELSEDKPLRLFIRQDPVDNLYPGLTQLAPGASQGASFSYTSNNFVQKGTPSSFTVSHSRGFTANGMVTQLLSDRINAENYSWVPAVWLSANGSLDHPRKVFGDNSALKFGPMFEIYKSGESPWGKTFPIYADIAPFYQTDFYGRASVAGATIGISPSIPELFLMAAPLDYNKPSIVDGFWVLRAEYSNASVNAVGQTNLMRHDYNWFGGVARAYVFLFPTRGGYPWPSYLADRVAVVGTVQSYWDAASHASAALYSVAVSYKLTCTTAQPASACGGGSTSLTVQYDNGKDRDTLTEQKKLTAKINFAF
jgi:hypothetical protein